MQTPHDCLYSKYWLKWFQRASTGLEFHTLCPTRSPKTPNKSVYNILSQWIDACYHSSVIYVHICIDYIVTAPLYTRKPWCSYISYCIMGNTQSSATFKIKGTKLKWHALLLCIWLNAQHYCSMLLFAPSMLPNIGSHYVGLRCNFYFRC